MHNENDFLETNFVPVRRVNYPQFSNPLTEIASQLPSEALSHLERERTDLKELARLNTRKEIQKQMIQGFTSMGNTFLATRSAGERHCSITINSSITDGGWEAFWGSGFRVKGQMNIDIF